MSSISFNYVTLSEASKMVGLTTGRLRQKLRAKELTGQKLGPRLWVVDESEVKKLAKQRKKQR